MLEETEAQARAREQRAQDNAARSAELLARDAARRDRAKAERDEARAARIQSEGRLAWQVLKVARIDKEKAEQELQVATESLANAQRKYDELVAQGYIDDISPVLEKEAREKAHRETADRERREKLQADAVANSGKGMTFEQREKLNDEIREANGNPNREAMCPQCRTTVRLVNGRPPVEHTYRIRNEFGDLEIRRCLPYGVESLLLQASPQFTQ